MAAVIVRDYADVLRGPAGPTCPTGIQDPTGAEGATVSSFSSSNPISLIVIKPTEWQTNYEDQYWNQTQVSLPGCSAKGRRIDCNFVMRPDQNTDVRVDGRKSRIALQNGKWVGANDVTIGQSTSIVEEVSVAKNIPTRFSDGFNASTGPGEGGFSQRCLITRPVNP